MESCLSVLLLLLATNSILYQNTAKSRMNGMMAWNRWQENLKPDFFSPWISDFADAGSVEWAKYTPK